MTFLSTSDFWTDHREVMTAQLPTYYTTLQRILGKYHVEEESFSCPNRFDVARLSVAHGTRTYVGAHFYVREPRHYLTMACTPSLGHATVSAMPLGVVTGTFTDGYDEVELGRAQGWYYPADRLWILWECYLTCQWRTHPLDADENLLALWQHVEGYLRDVCPDATRIVTPFRDPIAPDAEYQALLTVLGYTEVDARAFGKTF
jgi:hypothetical protein